MEEFEKKDFAKLLCKVGQARATRVTPGHNMIDLYWNQLNKYSMQAVRHGLTAHLNDPDKGAFFPAASDILRGINGSHALQATKAWNKVDYAVRSIGRGTSLVFDDARIHATLSDMGGIGKLCLTSERNYPFKKIEFEKLYARNLVYESFSYPRHIGPAPEKDSELHVIGDRAKAFQVFKNGSDKKKITSRRITGGDLLRLINAKPDQQSLPNPKGSS